MLGMFSRREFLASTTVAAGAMAQTPASARRPNFIIFLLTIWAATTSARGAPRT